MASAKELIKNKKNFIKFSPEGIHWGYHAHYIEEENGLISWYIPSFDIYYTSTTKEEGGQIGYDATKAFFEFWLKRQSFRKLVNKILHLGYKTENFQQLKNLLERSNINANLIGAYHKLPNSFKDSISQEHTGELRAAV